MKVKEIFQEVSYFHEVAEKEMECILEGLIVSL